MKDLVNILVMDVVLLQCRNYKPEGQNLCELVLFCYCVVVSGVCGCVGLYWLTAALLYITQTHL